MELNAFSLARGVLLFSSVFLPCFLLGPPLQLTCSLLFLFSIVGSYYAQSTLISIQVTLMQFVFEKVMGTHITFSGDRPKYGDSALVLSNHQSSCDVFMIGSLGWHLGMTGFTRYFIKDSVKYIPGFGWCLWLSGQLFIKRQWASDQKKIDQVLSTICKYQLPAWVVTYPEGTRLTQKKKEESQAFCAARKQPILENVLYPRTKGVVATITKFRNSHVKYIYDLTVAYRKEGEDGGFGKAPGAFLGYFLPATSPTYQFHIHIDKIPLVDLPTDPTDLSDWIVKRFQTKDKFLTNMKSQGWAQALAKHDMRLAP